MNLDKESFGETTSEAHVIIFEARDIPSLESPKLISDTFSLERQRRQTASVTQTAVEMDFEVILKVNVKTSSDQKIVQYKEHVKLNEKHSRGNGNPSKHRFHHLFTW